MKHLTPLELKTVKLVANGHLDKEIAYLLGVKEGTVKCTLHRVRLKLGIRSRVLITRWYLSLGDPGAAGPEHNER